MSLKFLQLIKKQAKKKPARIIMPETFDERMMEAAAKIIKSRIAHPVLLGNPRKIKKNLKEKGVGSFSGFSVIDATDVKIKNSFAEKLYELRKEKGLTQKQAKELIDGNINYLAAMLLKENEGDGMISGANSPTAETLRPALQIIKTKEKFHKVSGFFFMIMEKKLMLFADCAVNIEPNSNELAEIAIDTAETARQFGMEPRIAMLSFSTNGSTRHPNTDKVREAASMVRYFRPDLICEGEMQVDAALSPEVCKRKFPESKVCGDANILIFPNLESANIAYKLVQRLGHAQAIGPILQGFQKPVNDLSRGCSVDDIVNLAAITSVEAQEISLKSNAITAIL